MQWFLFPVNPNTKRPAHEGWQAESTDDATLHDLWESGDCPCGQGVHRLGVDCGKTKILVVDLDGDEGLATGAALDLPPTLRQHNGRHYIYAGEGRTTVRALGPGVDTRGRGGLIVWYGDEDDTPIAPLPAHLTERLAIRHNRQLAPAGIGEDEPYNLRRAYDWNERQLGAEEGQRNDTAYKHICRLRELAVSQETAFELAMAWNERNDPPLDEEEIERTVESAWKSAQNEAGVHGVARDPRTRFSGMVEPASPAVRSRYHLWSVAEALARPPPSWIFPRILPARSTGVVYGPTNIGKTWLVLDQALHAATGISGYGRDQCDPQDVVYFAGEGFEDLVHSRITAWCAHHAYVGALPRFHLLENFPDVSDDADVDILGQEIRQRELDPCLIVLDTYSRVLAQAGLNENDAVDVMKFVRQAEDLKRGFSCTVLAIHHSGKDLTRGARGAQTLLDNLDFGYEVSGDLNLALELRCEKMKAARKPDSMFFELIPQSDSLVVRGISETEARKLNHVEDELSSGSVAKALVKLGATDAEHAVTDYALAAALHPADARVPELEHQATIDRCARKLRAFGKGRHEQYVTKAGWHLPD